MKTAARKKPPPTPAPDEYRDQLCYIIEGVNVFLTRQQYDLLRQRYGPDVIERAALILDAYKTNSGKKYGADYYPMMTWAVQAAKKQLIDEAGVNLRLDEKRQQILDQRMKELDQERQRLEAWARDLQEAEKHLKESYKNFGAYIDREKYALAATFLNPEQARIFSN